MPRLRYSAESKDDLKQITRYIAQDKPIAARQWVSKIREKCRLVVKHPEAGDGRPESGENIRSTYVGSDVIFSGVRMDSWTPYVSFAVTVTHNHSRGTQRVGTAVTARAEGINVEQSIDPIAPPPVVLRRR